MMSFRMTVVMATLAGFPAVTCDLDPVPENVSGLNDTNLR